MSEMTVAARYRVTTFLNRPKKPDLTLEMHRVTDSMYSINCLPYAHAAVVTDEVARPIPFFFFHPLCTDDSKNP